MKARTLHSLAIGACIAGSLASPKAARALDFSKLNPVNMFKGTPEKSAPSDEERHSQEVAATASYQDVKTALSVGDTGKAKDLCKQIVRKYPFTDSAAEAQYTFATLLRKEGKLSDSFDAFQKVVDKFRQSPRFSESVQQQYEIAEEAKSGKKQGTMLMIPMKVETSEVIKMYQSVIKNAPYGKFAPLAQFSVAELYQEKGDKDQAVAAYQQIVDNHHGTKQATEAEFRIAAILNTAANRTQDASNRVHAMDALTQYKVDNPTGARVQETETLLNQMTVTQAQHALSIAKFYERSGKPKAAAIYYNEALRSGSPDAVLKARERLSALASSYGDDLKPSGESPDESTPLVAAAVNTKGRDDYAGPPGPELAKAEGKKPRMRMDDNGNGFKQLPVKEPELPTKVDSSAPSPGMLIPPAPGGEKLAPLPQPPPPGNGTLPIPPKPSN